MLRPLRITCEIIASLVGILILLALFLAWRLSAGPMQATFLTSTVESSIESLVPGTEVTIDHTLFAWNDESHAITLHADHVQMRDKAGRVIAEVPEFDTRLSLIGMLVGQFLPVGLAIDHPHVKLERQPDGAFTFGDVSTGGAADNGSENANFKQSLAGIAGHFAHAFFTHRLIVNEAVFDVHDIATSSDWSVRIPEISLSRMGRDLTGQAVIEVTQQDHTSAVTVLYTYDRGEGLHRLVAHLNGITPAFFAGGHPATLGLAQLADLDLPITGDIGIAFDSGLNIAAGNIDMRSGSGFLTNGQMWDKPRAVKSIAFKMIYDRDAGFLEIPAAVIDFGVTHINVIGKAVTHKKTHPYVMDFALNLQLAGLPMDDYGNVWPKNIIPGAREWIAANLSGGTFDHGEANLKGTLDLAQPDNSALTDAHGTITASEGRVQYVEGMPPVEHVDAAAAFDLNQMTVDIKDGSLGAIKLVPFTLQITGFEDDVQNIAIPLKVTGPIPDILRLIDYPPLGYTHAVGLTPEDVTGDTAAQVDFRFPLLRDLAMKDIGVTADATLSNVASSRLVKGLAVTQGNLALKLDTESFTLTGPASLNGIPLQVSLQQYFEAKEGRPLRQAEVSGTLTAAQWDQLGVDAFDGTRGAMNVSLHMTQPNHNKTLFTGTLDMTTADMRVDQLNWKKPAQIPAAASFTAEKHDDDTLDITALELHGPQLNVKGTAALSGEGDLEALSLDPMIVGRTNARLHFARPDSDNGALHFDAEGEALDISGFKGSTTPENAQPQPKEFRINVGKLYSSDDGFIAHAEGYAIRDAKGWSEINLHGLADGDHALNMSLAVRPDGGRDLSITCDDFGKALKGLGFADKVRGGELNIHGASDPADPRAIIGKISVGSFNVGNLPLLAVLMNAASPFGFAGLFSGSMDFDHIRGKFRWEGDTIRLDNVHAAGAAVGINIDGRMDLDSNDASLHGTMVPFSMVNSVIGSIPILGYLFTGGKDQGVFAVSYSITGPMGNPKTSVNPASLLTPGFLRTLFFGGNDDDDETPDGKAAKP